MNPTLVTIAGLIVAILIIMWAILEVTQRYTRQKKTNMQARRNAWVMVKPTTTTSIGDASAAESHNESTEDITASDLHKRAQQNGHYSQSKKPL